MNIEKMSARVKAITAIGVFLAGGWWLADEFGVRPVLSRDLVPLSVQVAANTSGFLWLRYRQLEKTKKYRVLTPRECAEYRGIAAQLNLPVPSC